MCPTISSYIQKAYLQCGPLVINLFGRILKIFCGPKATLKIILNSCQNKTSLKKKCFTISSYILTLHQSILNLILPADGYIKFLGLADLNLVRCFTISIHHRIVQTQLSTKFNVYNPLCSVVIVKTFSLTAQIIHDKKTKIHFLFIKMNYFMLVGT